MSALAWAKWPSLNVFVALVGSTPGPDAFPIEIGWCAVTGRGCSRGGSHLIRPEPEWSTWCAASEATHGITREMLASEGLPAAEVVRHALEVFRRPGVRLLSSGPTVAERLLTMLLSAAGEAPIPMASVMEAYDESCVAVGWQPEVSRAIVGRALSERPSFPARAEPVAAEEWWRWIWVGYEVADYLDGVE